MPECGAPFLREAIANYYGEKGVALSPEEIFVSSGASDELGDILDLFDRESTALVIEPAYPAYVDANMIAGRKIVHLPSGRENGFLPEPDAAIKADILYICSPNNPTGAVFNREKLQAWVDYAIQNGQLFCLTPLMKLLLKNLLCRTAFLKSKVPGLVLSRYVLFPKRPVLQAPGLDIR